ncbi:uncharacterized membrane protein (UPF0182 family) [Microbacteriaceae bacterium SG_E_30_P1]|uniref:UPF0182 protein M2152_000618 n=1 Tax=Antiquaquibacter oligotrophicus TaxID=2880260 RepID=A0ABT6KKE7_9MICO|nr:UPF0182 family protein [Antiquaquibacter oligotrophicus]MDH6180436.1 uncharacterized membrane protein (UPF0182 family) [Antiquaquibacter oligotrophicus]UDF13826.1 UPF0182 family protein [Antiquaquibacter oligotrophicus]
MSSTSSTPARSTSRTRVTLTITAVVIAVIVIAFFVISGLYTDVLWYDQLGYLPVLTTQWIAAGVMFLIGFFAMAIPVWLSIEIAFRARPVYAKLNSQLDRYQQVIEPLRRVAMFGIPAVIGIFAGVSTATRWPLVLQWLNKTPFGETDPQFGLDISFYFYDLPLWHGVVGFASAVVLLAGIAALATSYLYGAIRFSGREVRISRMARVQLAITAALYLLLQAVSLWLDQYTTLYGGSQGFLATGAGYTEANATIPGRAILAGIAALVAVLFIVTAIIGRWRLPIIGTALLLVSGLIVGSVYPWIVQRFQVEPNARVLESEYINRSIEATRAAYGVDGIEEVPYSAETDAEPGALREDAETTANIRILDPAIAPLAFAQLEQFKQYYQFGRHLDVDRYEIDGKSQDTVIAVRELNQSGLGDSQNWYNNTVVYTHGYGVVAAYGNQRAADGEPVFLESGIPSTGALGEFEPRVYFGEGSPEYSIVGAPEGAPELELDYPSGGEDSDLATTTTFSGEGGPALDNLFKQLIYAIKFQSEEIVLSDAVNEESQILYDRSPKERVAKVAPYLTLDSDTYPAIVDGRIVWIVDAYTTGSSYPYSQVESLSEAIADTYTPDPGFAVDQINYIRNSVKATVDAYDGSVTLYAWDDEDPVLSTWSKIFPSTIKPMSEMSDELLDHVRYPSDLFKMQRAILGSYHVTDAGSFFSSDDQWITPDDPVGGATAALQPPYYLTMQVPGTDEPAFTLYSTFIPRGAGDSTRNVLTGYLAVNADAGDDYGKLTLLTLPKQSTVPGPGQVQNNFTTDTAVANQLALLERGQTEVRRGNLLTLPVGGGLLYVQPVYVQSTSGTIYPLLRKVLVSFGDQIAFEDTLDGALDTLFGGDSGASAGDGDVPVEETPTEPTTPADPDAPEQPSTPSTGSAALQQALSDYQEALADRQAAYAANDLVAAAEADARMQDAIERAIAASE